jgi:uncharacterized membrane protein YbhN (UPF0104 family)
MNVLWLLGGLLCAGLSLALGAWRWQACLRALGMDIALPRLFKVTLTATAAGCISFGALGADLTKVVLAGRHLPGRQGGILSSLAMDHVSALPCVVVMVLAATLAHGTVPMLNMTGVWLALGVAALVAVAMAALGWKFKALHHGMMRMLADRATWRGLLRAVWRSVPMWMAYCGIYYCSARAFGVVVPVAGFAGVIAIADAVASLPVTIAGLGVREQAFRVLLGHWYDVPAAAAVTMSLTGFSLSLVWAAVGALSIGKGSVKSEKLALS